MFSGGTVVPGAEFFSELKGRQYFFVVQYQFSFCRSKHFKILHVDRTAIFIFMIISSKVCRVKRVEGRGRRIGLERLVRISVVQADYSDNSCYAIHV
jgi:hypothetical protein